MDADDGGGGAGAGRIPCSSQYYNSLNKPLTEQDVRGCLKFFLILWRAISDTLDGCRLFWISLLDYFFFLLKELWDVQSEKNWPEYSLLWPSSAAIHPVRHMTLQSHCLIQTLGSKYAIWDLVFWVDQTAFNTFNIFVHLYFGKTSRWNTYFITQLFGFYCQCTEIN